MIAPRAWRIEANNTDSRAKQAGPDPIEIYFKILEWLPE